MSTLKEIAKKIWLTRVEPRLLAAPLTVQLTQRALYSTEAGTVTSTTDETLIVSLTTFGKRIYEVYLTIESLLQQTLKPNKIILWLSKDEFNEDDIPIILKRQRKRGLEIACCEELRSYNKLIPTLQTYPKATIVTVDDDMIYPFDLLENLYKEHKKNPNTVVCYRYTKLSFDRTGNIKPYNKWTFDYQGNEKCMNVQPAGVGGVLYPPDCFHKDVLRVDLFTKLSPTADDVWFRVMTLLNGIPCKRVRFGIKAIPLHNNQDSALKYINITKKQNDVQIKNVFRHYKIPLSYKGIIQFQTKTQP